jgi:hypothetical protein
LLLLTVTGEAIGRAHYSGTGSIDPVDLIDDGTAETDLPCIKNHVLARCDGALWRIELYE